jgi:hypothetical protein
LDYVRDEAGDATVLVLMLGATYSAVERRELATVARGHARPVAVLVDDAVMAYLATRPAQERQSLAWVTLPFTGDCPYGDQAGDTPREMFYGRTRELSDVIAMTGPSFVSGGRQFGKSALLRTARRRFEEDDDGSGRRLAVFREIRGVGADDHAAAFWPGLASTLFDEGILETHLAAPVTAESVEAALMTWVRVDKERQLLILIDEADNFLSADAHDNRFDQMETCKRIMNDSGRRVKFVFAGLHRVARFESLSNQPLTHLGQYPIVVGPLQPRPARMMLIQPLAAIGYEFADPAAQTARILAVTNSVPSLLQLFGRALVTYLHSRDVVEGPRQVISDEDIDAVIEDATLLEQISARYRLTLRLDPRYEVMVNVVAHSAHSLGVDEGMTLAELTDDCRLYWPSGFASAGADLMRSLATECCDLGLLSFDSARYRMRTPTVLRLLGSEEAVSETLVAAEDTFELPTTMSAASYRPLLSNTEARSPLTTRQLAQVFSRRTQSLVVAGSSALGISRVGEAIRGGAHDRGLDGNLVKSVTPNPESLESAVALAAPGHTLVVDMHDQKHAMVAAVLDRASAVVPATEVSVVVVVDGRTSPVWVDAEDRINLTRVDTAGLALWLDQTVNPFHDTAERAALLEATGGWLSLVREALRRADGIDHAATALAEFAAWRDGTAAQMELVGLVGLGADKTKSIVSAGLGALARLVSEASGGIGETFADLVALADVADEDRSVHELLVQAGFVSQRAYADGIEALASLAVFDLAGDGTWRVEPVLAAALASIAAPLSATRVGA